MSIKDLLRQKFISAQEDLVILIAILVLLFYFVLFFITTKIMDTKWQ
jgi:hypothetical protein